MVVWNYIKSPFKRSFEILCFFLDWMEIWWNQKEQHPLHTGSVARAYSGFSPKGGQLKCFYFQWGLKIRWGLKPPCIHRFYCPRLGGWTPLSPPPLNMSLSVGRFAILCWLLKQILELKIFLFLQSVPYHIRLSPNFTANMRT